MIEGISFPKDQGLRPVLEKENLKTFGVVPQGLRAGLVVKTLKFLIGVLIKAMTEDQNDIPTEARNLRMEAKALPGPTFS